MAPCRVRDALPRAQPGSEPCLVPWGQHDPPLPSHCIAAAVQTALVPPLPSICPPCPFSSSSPVVFSTFSLSDVPSESCHGSVPHCVPGVGGSRAIVQRWCSQQAELCPSPGHHHCFPPTLLHPGSAPPHLLPPQRCTERELGRTAASPPLSLLSPPSISWADASPVPSTSSTYHAVIGGVVAVIVFLLLSLLIVLGHYLIRHKGTGMRDEGRRQAAEPPPKVGFRGRSSAPCRPRAAQLHLHPPPPFLLLSPRCALSPAAPHRSISPFLLSLPLPSFPPPHPFSIPPGRCVHKTRGDHHRQTAAKPTRGGDV